MGRSWGAEGRIETCIKIFLKGIRESGEAEGGQSDPGEGRDGGLEVGGGCEDHR